MNSEEQNNELENCPICLDFQNCDSIIMECCNKLIHSYCLMEWLKRRNNCPLCRTQQASGYDVHYQQYNREPISSEYNETIYNLFPPIHISNPTYFTEEEIPLLEPIRRRRRRGFYIPNIERNVNMGITSFNNRVQSFYREIEELENSLFNRVLNPYRRLINNLESSRRNNILDNIENNVDIGVTQNNIGVTYINNGTFDDIGISSMNIESNGNNYNININQDINLNFNIEQPINPDNYFNTISSIFDQINNQIDNLDDDMLDVD